MAYIEKGAVKTKRPVWRLSYIRDLFLSIINLIVVFFTTMFSMEKSDAYKKNLGSGSRWDGGPGGGGSGRGPYGGGPRGPPRGMDNVRGIDHRLLQFPAFLEANANSDRDDEAAGLKPNS